MTERIHVRAPATTANVGSAFDCAGVAFDLWNELEVVRDEDAPLADAHHLGIAAFGRIAPVSGWRFRFTYRIPRSSGLGSSAALIALGLVAGALAAEVEPDAEALLAEGLPLEGHPDNLAPALVGGACLTWEGRIARVADTVPAEPIALRPNEQVSTEHARTLLPISVPHEDAAFSSARAALLGAAFASGSEELFAAALEDRLHEPYRSVLLADVRAELPPSALGATLSGSGPTILVWARRGAGSACLDALRARWPEVETTPLAVSSRGAIP
ncbi:MAG TPA: homoserine kinase [Gaiellaceae bacterium]|nr:homoserine kinase [Gaiellaceae bacterium]